jgi:signal peptidase I
VGALLILGQCLSLAESIYESCNPRVVLVEQAGIAMAPTIADGQEIAVVQRTHFERFDIVLYSSPDGRFPRAVGRIIALGGETLEIREGQLFINGEQFDDVVEGPHRYTVPTVTISSDAVYILGDNRNYSIDSHVFGEVSIFSILGVIQLEPR